VANFPFFRGALGLNTAVESTRLNRTEEGFCELETAVNVQVDSVGALKVRQEILPLFVEPEAVHSLWSDGSRYCFYVSNGNLYRLMPDYSSVLVYEGYGNTKNYCVSFAGAVWMTNGSIMAWAKGFTFNSWDASTVRQRKGDTRQMGMPVVKFKKIFTHTGRLYGFVDNVLWESEPFDPRSFNLASGYIQFESEIIDAISIDTGIYLFLKDKTIFLLGESKEKFVKKTVAFGGGAVADTAKLVDGETLPEFYRVSGIAAVWVSQTDIFIGDDAGVVRSISDRKLEFNEIFAGASVVFRNNLMVSLEVE
jgi:hypothetical protein